MPLRLLCVGDMHLGRRPSRLPADLREHGVDPAELTPAAAWNRCVAHVLAASESERVDAVVLAGDVVESLEDRFEAYSQLERGVARLVEAGVGVYGVAGNHDGVALPRLAAQLSQFHLLGRDGRWECVRIEGRDGTPLQLLGWSFPGPQVGSSPLASLEQETELDSRAAILGVLHCDVDGGRSPYAPVPRSAFDRAPGDAWVLGHVHAPGELGSERPIGYLGSLTGLDPGEPGRHGPWELEIAGPGRVEARQLALAPLRWERFEVAVDGIRGSGLDREDQLFARLKAGLDQGIQGLGAELDGTRAVGCRIRLVGSLEEGSGLASMLSDPTRWPRASFGSTHCFIEKIVDATRPARDLARLAEGSDPPGLLARRLLRLDTPGPERDALLARAAREIEGGLRASRHLAEPATDAPPDPEVLREELLQSGFDLLEALLEQVDREAPAEDPRT